MYPSQVITEAELRHSVAEACEREKQREDREQRRLTTLMYAFVIGFALLIATAVSIVALNSGGGTDADGRVVNHHQVVPDVQDVPFTHSNKGGGHVQQVPFTHSNHAPR